MSDSKNLRHNWHCYCDFRIIFLAYSLGLTLWNLSCLEFKFDDTRLSYWHKKRIGRIKNFFVASWLCLFSALLACSVLLRRPTGLRISKVRKQQTKISILQSYTYVNRKVSSNLNSKQLRFHSVRPSVHTQLTLMLIWISGSGEFGQVLNALPPSKGYWPLHNQKYQN